MQIVDIVHILYLEEILSVLLKIKHQINTLTCLNVVFSLKTMYILRMPFPLDIDQLGEASKKSFETNAKRSAAAAKYSSRFSGSVLSRALKEL